MMAYNNHKRWFDVPRILSVDYLEYIREGTIFEKLFIYSVMGTILVLAVSLILVLFHLSASLLFIPLVCFVITVVFYCISRSSSNVKKERAAVAKEYASIPMSYCAVVQNSFFYGIVVYAKERELAEDAEYILSVANHLRQIKCSESCTKEEKPIRDRLLEKRPMFEEEKLPSSLTPKGTLYWCVNSVAPYLPLGFDNTQEYLIAFVRDYSCNPLKFLPSKYW